MDIHDFKVRLERTEKRIQRALLRYKDERNYGLVYEGLKMAERADLIGNEWKCLIEKRTKSVKTR